MRRQLSVLVAAVTSAVVVAFLVPLALLVRTLATDRAMSAATEEAHNVAVLAAVVRDSTQLEPVVSLVNQRSERRTTVFLGGGRLVGAAAPVTPAVRQAFAGTSLTVPEAGGRAVLVPVDTGGQVVVVQTFVPEGLLHRGVLAAWLILGGLGAALLAVAVLTAAAVARRIARPIATLADAAHRLTGGDLSARVEPTGPPEVVEVGRAFNRLGGRVRELLAAEREMVADLSHRLRTPITALRLDAETLTDPTESARIAGHVDALATTVDDVIREARRPVAADLITSSDATAVVRDRVAFWAVLAEDQQRPLTVDVPDRPLAVRVPAEELAAAVDALLGNVFQHTPETARMHVGLSPAAGGGARIVVADTGCGLPDQRAAERGRSGSGSTGLGLDIVRRTAEASGGRLTVESVPGEGTTVELVLGPAPD